MSFTNSPTIYNPSKDVLNFNWASVSKNTSSANPLIQLGDFPYATTTVSGVLWYYQDIPSINGPTNTIRIYNGSVSNSSTPLFQTFIYPIAYNQIIFATGSLSLQSNPSYVFIAFTSFLNTSAQVTLNSAGPTTINFNLFAIGYI